MRGICPGPRPEQQAQVLARRLWLSDQHSGIRSLAEQALRLAPNRTEVRAEILLESLLD